MAIDFSNKVLFVQEKYGTDIYEVKDAKQCYRVLLKLATERFNDDWYFDEDLARITKIFHMKEGPDKRNALYGFMQSRTDLEYECFSIETLICL